MDIKAYKMDGLGNDFIIIDQRDKIIKFSEEQIIKICDRNFIGCDQLIIIKKNKEFDANLEFFNSDGSASGACGNGTRCVAYLLYKESNKKEITFCTSSSVIRSKILDNNLVETDIGAPKVQWNEIPLSENKNTKNLGIKILDENNNEHIGGTAVNVGNPHVVFFVDNIENFNIKKIGPLIENNKLFPEKCNVTIAKLINKNLITVKVWERGAGPTKACGTAACATAIAGNINGYVKEKIDVEFELGKLSIFIDEKNNIHMKGPVSKIKEIDIKL
jgi:diaminopimelate epimerase|tara:strand:+ start:139 stop:963 length:825 start_codon:yes stop_codon:yes gene_type:complete